MSPIEIALRISVMQAEMMRIARDVDPHTAAVLMHASRVLRLVKPASVNVSPKIEMPITNVGA